MNITGYSSIFTMVLGLAQIPLYLVWFGGIIWAVYHWSKHPKVSLIVTIVLGLIIGMACMNMLLPMVLYQNLSMDEAAVMIMVMNGSSALIHAGLWVALLVATFGWRTLPDEEMKEIV